LLVLSELRNPPTTNGRKEYDRVLQYAQDNDDRSGEAASLTGLGLVAYEEGEYDEARAYHQQSLSIKRDIGDRAGEAKSLGNLGSVADEEGEYDEARARYEPARDLFADLGAVHHELMARKNLVRTERDADAIDRARERCKAALARLDEIDREFPDRREWFADTLDDLDEAAPTED
jgi:tetratricopeptide (TPR) repeat protein